jgi:hypothetical protein
MDRKVSTLELAAYLGPGTFEIYGMELPDSRLGKIYHLNGRMFGQFKGKSLAITGAK